MSDGQVVFEITADGKHAIADVKEVTKAIESESKKWDKSAKEGTDAIDSSFSKMLGKVAGSLAAAGVASILKNWGSAAISAASDLREVQNVVDVTFGESASAIESWSKKASEQFGLTETQAKKFTSTLGAMMKSAGVSDNDIVKMSTDLAGLAADMASFYNLDFDTAFQKIRSGISGETEPLKQLGVNMSVANLEAFALQKGLEKTFSQMTQSEQTMLRYQYIMQATADAQGDFARTSDGFANSQRRVEAAMDNLKAKGGDLLLNIIEPLSDKFATFLENLTKEPQRTVLDDLNNIELDTASKLAEVENTYNKASDLIKVLDDISKEVVTLSDGTVLDYETIFSELGDIEKSGGDIRQYIQSLGLDVDTVVTKYGEWKQATQQLTQLVPDLSSVIDAETGSIDGGTEALQKNLDEWKSIQEQKIEWAAYYAAEEALAVQKGEQAALQLTADARQKQLERAKAAVEEIAKTPGLLQHDLSWYGDTAEDLRRFSRFNEQPNAMTDEQKAYNAALDEYVKVQGLANEAAKEASKNAEANAEAEQLLADKKQVLIDKYGEQEKAIEDVSEVVDGYLGKTTDEWKETTDAVNESVKALADYVQGVHDATEASVNNTLNGFKRVQTAAQQNEEAANKMRDLEKELRESGKYTDKEIEIKLNAANAQITLNELNESLQSQLDFIREYEENLQKARDLGVDDSVLAMLSDGSNESARQLHAIAEAYKEWNGEGVPEDIQKLNELFKEVSDSKGTFTDTLTQQKLTVDQTYDAMVDKAMTAIEEMNLADEATDAMEQTVEGIADGINAAVPDVASAVDAVLAELDRLSVYGMSFSFDENGNIQFNLDGSHATGLDHVPFDGYLAELHEGEGILTAEENRIWQRFKAGQHSSANVDYDALGGVMRDNVHAGGNVYLDSRVVGQVVSQIQGNQYRTMQRSGFQQ